MRPHDFLAKLKAYYRQSTPEPLAIQDMLGKLKGANLSSDAVQRLFDHLTAKCQFHPTWFDVSGAIAELGVSSGKKEKPIFWQLYDLDGIRYARKTVPGLWPALPEGASNGVLAIPPEAQAHYEPCSTEEGRPAFLAGWKETGVPSEEPQAYYEVLLKRNSAPEEPPEFDGEWAGPPSADPN